MQRLTDERGCLIACDACPERSGCQGACVEADKVLSRLAEYENLGLTPEELRQMDKLYREKREELAKVEAAIAEASKKQQEDEIFYLDSYNKGWRGAVEFIRSRNKGDDSVGDDKKASGRLPERES